MGSWIAAKSKKTDIKELGRVSNNKNHMMLFSPAQLHTEDPVKSPLQESNKALECILSFDRLTKIYGLCSDQLIHKLISIIPSAFQFPRIICSRVSLSSREFKSKNFARSPWKLTFDVAINELVLGKIEVYYLNKKPRAFQGPFLKDEVDFIHSLANRLAVIEEYRIKERENRLLDQEFHNVKLEVIARLSARIAHDFNNLLTVINGYSKHLLDKSDETDIFYSDLKEIHQAGKLGAELIRNLMSFNKIYKVNLVDFELNSILVNSEDLFRSILGSTVKLSIKRCGMETIICSDKNLLTKTLLNILSNAKDAMPDGGRLSITTSIVIIDESFCLKNRELTPGQYVILSIKDTGKGIPISDLQRIFDPFFTTKDGIMGMGLGLASSLQFVRQCKGKMVIESNQAEDTRVLLFFPVSKKSSVLQKPSGPLQVKSTKKGNVFFLTEDNVTESLLSKILQDHGYNVIITPSQSEAIEVCRNATSIDILLVDILKPEMERRQFYQKFSDLEVDMKLVLIVDHQPKILIEEEIQLSHVYFIYKPVDVPDLLHYLEDIVKGDADTVKKSKIPRNLANVNFRERSKSDSVGA